MNKNKFGFKSRQLQNKSELNVYSQNCSSETSNSYKNNSSSYKSSQCSVRQSRQEERQIVNSINLSALDELKTKIEVKEFKILAVSKSKHEKRFRKNNQSILSI